MTTADERSAEQELGQLALRTMTGEDTADREDDRETDPAEPAPRIWVGSLSDYNNGRFTGEWIKAYQEAEDLLQEIQLMLKGSSCASAEEWGIFDYEGLGGLRLDEYQSIETVARIARGLPTTDRRSPLGPSRSALTNARS